MVHLLASFASLIMLAFGLGVIAHMLGGHRARIVAALRGQAPRVVGITTGFSARRLAPRAVSVRSPRSSMPPLRAAA
jgi:hypothetical protein